MGKLVLYSAASIDGYIAGANDDLTWLEGGDDFGYDSFYKSIGITLMGNNTYKLVKSFGDFPYPDKRNYVFTRNKMSKDDPHVTFISDDITGFVRLLKEKEKDDIWLVGGGEINGLLGEAGLIDRMMLFIFPVLLGSGTPIFSGKAFLSHWYLQQSKQHASGVLELHYATAG